ncbi:MAG: hypothetical protein GW876_11275 [Bacteroidetes bacterium]|nr:hypothetical protein [Bacteroidota bacterium]PIP54717.1 MAG: hypothetical protein COX07_03785 [Bacteroidetes bacterium CG23_combo_of_CG06-09_8_20_14_all_32_9]
MNRRKIFLIFVIGLISISNKLYSQDRIKRTLQFSARYTFYYNYKVAHHSPVFSIEFNKHNFYLGPEYSLILKPIKGDPVNIYEKKSFGINLGYRYFFSEQSKKLKVFSQFNFAIFQIKYKEYQLGPPFVTEHNNLIIENTVTLGIDYNIWNNIHIFSGGGIGSFGGFFLIIDAFTPSSYIGIEYKF